MKQQINAQLLQALRGNLDEYKSIPFWSWNNSLDKKELVRQIEEMKSVGMGGFIIHARQGLKDEYLGEKWFSCVEACLQKARELSMQVWIYDENGWPSGFVGGKLLQNESFRARFLEMSKGAFDKTAYAVFVADKGKGYVRISEPSVSEMEYYNIYLRVSPANTDILNPNVVAAFLAETHEQYYSRFKDSFGRELAGFFTDEPQYYRAATPYTPCAEQAFTKCGEDIRDGLIWLFVHDERGYAFREKYYGILNELYVENYYKKIYEWCEAHHCKLTGHSIEEGTLFGQMWGGASVSPTYEYEHMPAMDWLGRTCCSQLAPKQVGSVASQLGKKFVLTETFACAGYDVTPQELKSIAEAQYFNGVSMMCQHLYPYSIAGQGKTDHPPVFSPHGNWFDGFKEFNDYFTRLGYIISNTQEKCDVAILHPIRNIWLDYIKTEEYGSVKDTEDEFNALLCRLRQNGVTFQLIDERILQRHGAIEGNELRVGNRKYSSIIVPKMHTIAETTLDILKKFTGKLCVLSDIPYVDGEKRTADLQGNISIDEIEKTTEIKFHCDDGNSFMTSRTGTIGSFIFIKNLSSERESIVRFENVANRYVAFDLDTLSVRNISDCITLSKGKGLVLLQDESAAPTETIEMATEITDSFKVTSISDNYMVLDTAKMCKGGAVFGYNRPVQALFEELLREDYVGKISIKHTFSITERMPLSLVMEKMDYIAVRVNGKNITLTQSAFDVNFVEADIDDFLVVGENTIEYELDYRQHDGVHFALFDPLATESLRNCLYYDMSIEPIYLKGDFVVNEDNTLSKRISMPAMTSALHKTGYPFFKGKICLAGKVFKPDTGKVALRLQGRFMMATVKVNEKETNFVLDTAGDISDLLHEGENDVKITVYSSLRNLFGPHHYKPEAEPLGVSPHCFTMRGTWENGEDSWDYTPEYHTVPFGVDKIFTITTKG